MYLANHFYLDCDIQNICLWNDGEIEKTIDGLNDKMTGLNQAWVSNHSAFAIFPIVNNAVSRKTWYLVSK